MSNPFYIFTREQLRYILAIFILGIFIGSTGLNLVVSNKIDNLILTRNELEKEIEQQNQKIEQLEENIREHRNTFITDINIEINSDLNQHKQQEINDIIYQLLENQMGKEVSEFDPYVIKDIIDDRPVSLEDSDEDSEIHLNLDFLIVYNQELRVIVTVE